MAEAAGARAESEARRRLLRLLRLAYSGELGAAIAYRGHARSVRDPGERARLLQIEAEERDHRERLGRMLAGVGIAPSRWLEFRSAWVGRGIAVFCAVGSWFLPMYGAGQIERRNRVEYENAARAAVRSGYAEFAHDLIAMAEVEWEHEEFFRLKAVSHPLSRIFPIWSAPPPKEEIARTFERAVASVRPDRDTPIRP
jgi:hypothetical protein